MPVTDAVLLDNWFPTVGAVTVRKGYTEHVTGLGSGNVETLAEYQAGATRHLIASCDGELFNATTAATSLGDGYSNDRWQTVNFNSLLVMVNGEDTPVSYNGTAVSNMTWGVIPDSSTLIGVAVSHNRLFFWEDDSQSFWYADVNVITGDLAEFNLSRVGRFGGKIVSIFNWTIDTGEGLNDVLVILFSSGQAVVYNGTDPADVDNWALEGVYDVGEPITHRGTVQIGSDVRIITSQDYLSFPQVMTEGRLGVPSKASGAIQAAYATGSTLFGWDAVFFPEGTFVLFNVPATATTSVQHVLNTTTGAWARFKDINTTCWGTFNKGIYFGGAGVIYEFWDGEADNEGAIAASALQAWTDFGSEARKKVTTYRPVLSTNGALEYSSEVGYDFIDPPTLTPSSISSQGTPWGSPWGSPWSPSQTISQYYDIAQGSGVSLAVKVKVLTLKAVSWLRTDLRAEIGQNL